MTITSDRRDLYPNMTRKEQAAIDISFNALTDVLTIFDIPCAGDDRAENLVGAIARFIEDSKR